MKQITYTNEYGESITFGRVPPLVLEDIDANSVGTSSSASKAIGQNGQTTSGITYNPRTIILNLSYKGVRNGKWSESEAREIYQRIARVFLLRRNGLLEYTNSAGDYKIQCRPLELPDPEHVAGQVYRLRFEMLADNPFWLTSRPFRFRLGIVEGGKRYPLRYPLRFGTWIKEANIINDTLLYTPMTITVSGTADYIEISNTKTGEYIRVLVPVAENEKMVIWTGDEPYVELITYDEFGQEVGREFANYKLDLGSRYLQLAPGENNFVLDNGYPSILPLTVIEYYQYHQGV